MWYQAKTLTNIYAIIRLFFEDKLSFFLLKFFAVVPFLCYLFLSIGWLSRVVSTVES